MTRRPASWFNQDEADRVVEWWESTLRHTEGLWAGQPFVLEDWQREEIIRPLFGWQRWDDQYGVWVRKFSRASIWMPRGNGKTPIAAGIILEGLTADGEHGAQCYGAAEDRDQATVVFRDVRLMVKYAPTLADRLHVLEARKRIVDEETDSFYQALPRDEYGEGSQGLKPHISVVDEYHVQKSKGLVDALKKGMGKRLQPLFVTISTAGEDAEHTPAGEDYRYARKVRDRQVEDPGLFVFIAEAVDEEGEPATDPFDLDTIRRANPALGGRHPFLSMHTIEEEIREAQAKPSERVAFERFRLGRWKKSAARWLGLDVWDASAGMVVESDLHNRVAFGGVHAVSNLDLVAIAWDFPGEDGHDVLWRHFLPEEKLEDLVRRTGGAAAEWVREGRLTLTPGSTIDHGALKAQIQADAGRFSVQEIAYHRFGFTQAANELEQEGLTLPQFGVQNAWIEPTKDFEALVLKRQLRHSGNPIVRWQIGNAVARKDGEGNTRVDPKLCADTATGIFAALMALDRATRAEEDTPLVIVV